MACYGIGYYSGIEIKSQFDFIEWLRKARFPIPAYIKIARGVDEVINAIKELEKYQNLAENIKHNAKVRN